MKIFENPKTGFGVPLSNWLKGPLKNWANFLMYEHKFSDEFNLNNSDILKLWEEFNQNIIGNEKLIWNILILKSWDLRWNGRN